MRSWVYQSPAKTRWNLLLPLHPHPPNSSALQWPPWTRSETTKSPYSSKPSSRETFHWQFIIISLSQLGVEFAVGQLITFFFSWTILFFYQVMFHMKWNNTSPESGPSSPETVGDQELCHPLCQCPKCSSLQQVRFKKYYIWHNSHLKTAYKFDTLLVLLENAFWELRNLEQRKITKVITNIF